MAAIPPTSPTPFAPAVSTDTARDLSRMADPHGRCDRTELGADFSAGLRGLDTPRGRGLGDAGGTPLHSLAFAKLFGAPIAVAQAGAAAPSKVDAAVATLTTSNVDTDAAIALWQSLSGAEQRALTKQLIEQHPAAAAEFANQLQQGTDKTASKEFWRAAEAWLTESVADNAYHTDRLPLARAFIDQVSMLAGPGAEGTKNRAMRSVNNIQFSDEYGDLSKRAGRNSVTKASLGRAQLHIDTWISDLSSGDSPSLKALARQDPAGFVNYLDGLRGDKKAYDAAIDEALTQPSVDYTGRGTRGGHSTDVYMENLIDAVARHGSADVKADFAMRTHKGGSLRPGYEDAKAARRDLLADPAVLSIALNEKSEAFSLELRSMIAKDPARAQEIIAAGVAGYTAAYSEAMAKTPPDLAAAEDAAYDLGLLLGETKEAAQEAFTSDAKGGYNFLKGVFTVVSKRLLGLVPGGNIAADIGKDLLGELASHFATQASKFQDSDAPTNIDAALTKFVDGMFGATRDSFWTMRDPSDVHGRVKSSPELDKLETEYKQFVKWVDAGDSAGRDGHNNAARSR